MEALFHQVLGTLLLAFLESFQGQNPVLPPDDFLIDGSHPSPNGSLIQEAPGRGTVQAIALDPRDPSRLYALGSGHVYVGQDRGGTWLRGTDTLLGRALLVDPQNTAIVYVGTSQDGLYRSTDGGYTFRPTAITGTDVGALAADPQTGRIYAGAVEGIYVSDDSGASWALLAGSPGGASTYGLVADPTNPNIIHAAKWRQGIFRTLDSGSTWAQSDAGLIDNQLFDLDIDANNPGVLYAAAFNGVYRSVDGGASWSEAGDLFSVSEIAIHPRAPATLFAATEQQGVFRSFDGGATWEPVNEGFGAVREFIAIAVADDDTVYAGSVSEGVFRSDNLGQSWTPLIDNPQGSNPDPSSPDGGGSSAPGNDNQADLQVTIIDRNPEKMEAGGFVRFAVELRNNGPTAATDVTLTVNLWNVDGLGYRASPPVSIKSTEGNCQSNGLCNIGTVASGTVVDVDVGSADAEWTATYYLSAEAVSATADGDESNNYAQEKGPHISTVTVFETDSGGGGGSLSLLSLVPLILLRMLGAVRKSLPNPKQVERVRRSGHD